MLVLKQTSPKNSTPSAPKPTPWYVVPSERTSRAGFLPLISNTIRFSSSYFRGRVGRGAPGLLRVPLAGLPGRRHRRFGAGRQVAVPHNRLPAEQVVHHFALPPPACIRGVARAGLESRRIDSPFELRVEDDDVRRHALRDNGAVTPTLHVHDARGGDCEPGYGVLDRHDALVHQPRDDKREACLEPDAAELGPVELGLFFVRGVRRVVGRYHVDGPVGDRLQHRGYVLFRPQGRVHLQVGVVSHQAGVVQREVVRRRLAGDRKPGFLRRADQIDGAGRREVRQVTARPGLLRQADVPEDPDALGLGWNAPEPEESRVVALVHLSVGGEALLLAVRDDHRPHGAGVLHGPAHYLGVGHRVAVVAESFDPGAARPHLAHRGERLALTPLGDRPVREYHAQPLVLAAVEHVLGNRRVVYRWVGVGHAEDRRVAAARRGPAAASYVFLVLHSGLAQVGVHLDEARRHDAPGSVDDLAAVPAQASPDLGDGPVFDLDVRFPDEPLREGEDPAALDQNAISHGYPPGRRRGQPSAPLRLRTPARLSPTPPRRPPPRLSPLPCSWGRGA